MEIRWARSATRHRINRERSGHVVRHPAAVMIEPAPGGSPFTDDRIVFLGPDQEGVLLEVMAVQTSESLVVIHAMRMRARYRRHLTEGDR